MSIEDEEIICFKKSDVLEAIKYLEVIRLSLAKIGRNSQETGELSLLSTYFLIDFKVFEKISFIWKVLQENIPENELDEELERIKYWNIPENTDKQNLIELINKIQ